MLQSSTSYRVLMILSLVMMSIFGSMFAQTNPSKGPSPEPKAEATATPPAATDYDIRWGVKIPLRDKVELNATLYFPKMPDGSAPKTPVIFTLTPYISDTTTRGGHISLRTATFLRWSMFAAAEIPPVNSSRS